MPAPGSYPPPGNPEGVAGHLLRVLPLPYGANIPFQIGHMINNHVRANNYREYRNNAIGSGLPGRTAAPTGLHLNESAGNQDYSGGGPHPDSYGLDPFGESGGYNPDNYGDYPDFGGAGPSPNGLPGSESNPPGDTTTDPYQGWQDYIDSYNNDSGPQVQVNPDDMGYTNTPDEPYQNWQDHDTGDNEDNGSAPSGGGQPPPPRTAAPTGLHAQDTPSAPSIWFDPSGQPHLLRESGSPRDSANQGAAYGGEVNRNLRSREDMMSYPLTAGRQLWHMDPSTEHISQTGPIYNPYGQSSNPSGITNTQDWVNQQLMMAYRGH